MAAIKRQTEPEFDEAAHVYRLAGRPVPSVTQVIDAVIPRTFNPPPFYLGRGSAIHKAIQLSVAGQLDMPAWLRDLETSDLTAAEIAVIVNKTEAAAKFLRETGYRVLHTEIRLASRIHRYAGTIDAIAESDKCSVIVDWKSSIEPRVELQLGGYYELARLPPNACACAVELRDDGSYRMHFYKAPQVKLYRQEFIALLSTYQSMKTRNLLPKKGE